MDDEKMQRTVEIQAIVSSGDSGYVTSRATTHIQVRADQAMTTIIKDISMYLEAEKGWECG